MDLNTILKTAFEADASDVHLIAGQPPMCRIHQVMTRMDFPVITPEVAKKFFEQMASKETQATYERQKDADFSYFVE
ncbi:MAG: type IV pili twitching motility protein PilT, partial [Phycisphaerae bacterium]